MARKRYQYTLPREELINKLFALADLHKQIDYHETALATAREEFGRCGRSIRRRIYRYCQERGRKLPKGW